MRTDVNKSNAHTTPLNKIHSSCVELCRHFGFDQFLYIAKCTSPGAPELIIVNGSPLSQPTSYSQGILRVNKSASGTHHQLEKLLAIFPIEFKNEILNIVCGDPHHMMLHNYLSFPVKFNQDSSAVLILASSTIDKTINLTMPQLSQAREFALKIHQTAKSLINNAQSLQLLKLTKRENECLHWAASGKTNWEIGTILGVSKRTVIFHLQNAAKKFNTSNRYHTVAYAIANGLVTGELTPKTR